jgi:hypothetical protein
MFYEDVKGSMFILWIYYFLIRKPSLSGYVFNNLVIMDLENGKLPSKHTEIAELEN